MSILTVLIWIGSAVLCAQVHCKRDPGQQKWRCCRSFPCFIWTAASRIITQTTVTSPTTPVSPTILTTSTLYLWLPPWPWPTSSSFCCAWWETAWFVWLCWRTGRWERSPISSSSTWLWATFWWAFSASRQPWWTTSLQVTHTTHTFCLGYKPSPALMPKSTSFEHPSHYCAEPEEGLLLSTALPRIIHQSHSSKSSANTHAALTYSDIHMSVLMFALAIGLWLCRTKCSNQILDLGQNSKRSFSFWLRASLPVLNNTMMTKACFLLSCMQKLSVLTIGCSLEQRAGPW